nr:hypothetical protein [Mycoplasmopsis bovis]
MRWKQSVAKPKQENKTTGRKKYKEKIKATKKKWNTSKKQTKEH